ncbi:hypothetical protein ACFTAO_13990 [Paenibacillus rhizoplanae]
MVSGEYGVLVENGAGEPVYDYHNGLPSFESAKAAEERASDFIVISQALGVTGWKLVFLYAQEFDRCRCQDDSPRHHAHGRDLPADSGACGLAVVQCIREKDLPSEPHDEKG